MRRAAPAAIAAALASLAWPAGADAADLKRAGCRTSAPGEWRAAGEVATAADGTTVELIALPAPGPMISMTEGGDFEQVEENDRLVIFRRKLPQGRSHFRSITRTTPSCTAEIVISSRAEDRAIGIARRLSRIEPTR